MFEYVNRKALLASAVSVLTACTLFGANPAAAHPPHQNWPSSIVGTWNGIADTYQISMTVATQSSGTTCQEISGTIVYSGTTQDMFGWYCPKSGRIHFQRQIAGSGHSFQDFNGNLSDRGTTTYMAGEYADMQGSGYSGEYSWSLSK